MKLVVLTGEGPEHRYVAARLAAAFGSDLRAVIVARGKPRPLTQRVRSYVRRYTTAQLLSRIAARLYTRMTGVGAHRQAVIARELGARTAALPPVPADVLHVVSGHNNPDCLDLLRSIGPDVIAVYGTVMIKGPTLDMASQAMLNMHTGLSPYYRGSDTIFWPLHNEEPEYVGVTVHVLDRGIDSGAIVAVAKPAIEADDDEHSLFCKAVIAGTELYIAAVKAAHEGTLQSTPQDLGIGREYRFVHRTMSAERRVARLLRGGLLRRYAQSQAQGQVPVQAPSHSDASRASAPES